MRRAWVLVLLALAGCGGDPAPEPTAAPSRAAPVLAADVAALTRSPGLAAGRPGAAALDPATARLEGPHFAYSVSAVGRTRDPLPDTVAGPLRLAAGAVPAPGQELLLVDLGRTAGRPAAPGPDDVLLVEVAAGEVTRPLRVPADGDLGGTVAVSVPAGSRPVLRITDAGRRQSLDLTTGRRGADAVAGYYPVPTGRWDADGTVRPTGLGLYGPGVAGQTRADRLAAVRLDGATAAVQPWAAGRGWARTGRGWLVLTPSVGYARAPVVGSPDPDTVTVPPACFRVAGPDGRPVPLTGDPLRAGTPGELVADVPAGLRRVTVRFAFCGSVRTAAGEVSYRVESTPAQTADLTLR